MKVFAARSYRYAPRRAVAATRSCRLVRRAPCASAVRQILRAPVPRRESSSTEVAAPSYIAGLPGRGASLPASVRAFMEPRFGASFADVRIHSDREAARSATSLGARAYTFGSDIVFGAGQYSPETSVGRRLIAHELAHVVRQKAGGNTPAQRIMRSPLPGCDKATTQVDDPDVRIREATKQAGDMLAKARAQFPQMSERTMRLVETHFHCPSISEMKTIVATLAQIESFLGMLQSSCIDKNASVCKSGDNGAVHAEEKAAEWCPVVFGPKNRAFLFAGLILDAAAQLQKDKKTPGMKNTCLRQDACYLDFTKPAADMVENALSYAALVVELNGHSLVSPATVPCDPIDTGLLVYVPPDAAKDPTLIRPVGSGGIPGLDTAPAGAAILSVFEDRAGHRFIYHPSLPGAQVFTAAEAAEKPPRRRFYFPAGRAP